MEKDKGRRWRWLRFHPMRLLLTGSPCLEKSPLWLFGPHGGGTTSMGKRTFGCRGGERERMERQTAFRELDGATGGSKA